jgi:hypothetical protein
MDSAIFQFSETTGATKGLSLAAVKNSAPRASNSLPIVKTQSPGCPLKCFNLLKVSRRQYLKPVAIAILPARREQAGLDRRPGTV